MTGSPPRHIVAIVPILSAFLSFVAPSATATGAKATVRKPIVRRTVVKKVLKVSTTSTAPSSVSVQPLVKVQASTSTTSIPASATSTTAVLNPSGVARVVAPIQCKGSATLAHWPQGDLCIPIGHTSRGHCVGIGWA